MAPNRDLLAENAHLLEALRAYANEEAWDNQEITGFVRPECDIFVGVHGEYERKPGYALAQTTLAQIGRQSGEETTNATL